MFCGSVSWLCLKCLWGTGMVCWGCCLPFAIPENKIRHFTAVAKDSICHPAFQESWIFYLQRHSEILWRLETLTGNYFWVLHHLGKAKVLTGKKGWRCLFLQPFRFVPCWCEGIECGQAVPPLRIIWNLSSSIVKHLLVRADTTWV